MATTLNATVSVAAVGTYVDDTQKTTQTQRIAATHIKTITNGTALASDCDLYFEESLTGTGVDTYTLDDASMTDEYGNTLTFARIKAIIIENTHATNDVTLSGDFVTTWLPPKIRATGICVATAFTTLGMVVGGATNVITYTATSGTVIRTRIWGASA